RDKLSELARETGGRSFFIHGAEELAGVYSKIEKELRTRYLITYTSDRPPGKKREFRTVHVEVDKRGLTARTIHGYYP
ncbi:MAG TPA: VWA domain-containing protein, partial [Thermoanaerobaculia bacterium]|nr:VWA domain-containing protein [Thermoanaerobaculia bacterium]